MEGNDIGTSDGRLELAGEGCVNQKYRGPLVATGGGKGRAEGLENDRLLPRRRQPPVCVSVFLAPMVMDCSYAVTAHPYLPITP